MTYLCALIFFGVAEVEKFRSGRRQKRQLSLYFTKWAAPLFIILKVEATLEKTTLRYKTTFGILLYKHVIK